MNGLQYFSSTASAQQNIWRTLCNFLLAMRRIGALIVKRLRSLQNFTEILKFEEVYIGDKAITRLVTHSDKTKNIKENKMKKKILSLLTAFAMVFGILVAPFTSANAAGESDAKQDPNISTKSDAKTQTVTLHKLMMTTEELNAWKALTEEQYDGRQDLAKLNTNLGKTLKEVPDVYFVLKFAKDYSDTTKAGKYVKASGTTDEEKLIPATPLAATDNLEEAVGGLTKDNGVKFNTATLEGKFEIDEVVEKSTYIGKTYFNKDTNAEVFLREGRYYTDKTAGQEVNADKVVAKDNILTGSLAVPVAITLPLVNKDGTVLNAHVYPKNSQDKPEIDKNFAKAKTGEKELVKADDFPAADEGAGIGVGADYKNYTKTKATAKAELGKKIPYEVKTKIPAKSKLQLAKWNDHMTNGLTYNKDLTIKIGETALTKTTDYTIDETDSGFELALTEEGLKKVNGKDAAVELVLTYSATVNKNAMADIPDTNEVRFRYGNNKSKETKPVPGKPNTSGELKVEKTWDDGKWAQGEKAKFELRDATTGRTITSDDLVEPSDENAIAAFKAYKESFNAVVEIGHPTTGAKAESAAWKYLNPNKTYIAVEIESTTPSDVEYVQGEDGTLKATNHKSVNPRELKPTRPQVVTGGRKFVKTNDKEGKDLKRLANAKFFVKRLKAGQNNKYEYLVAKKSTEANAEAVLATEKETALNEAVKNYNDAEKAAAVEEKDYKATTIGKTTYNTLADLKAALPTLKNNIDKAQVAYNTAFIDAANKYTWVDEPAEGTKDERVVLISDSQGRFEISDLEYGTYYLEEKVAPADFAKLDKNDQNLKFEVKKGSYAGTKDKDLKYTEKDNDEGDTLAKDGYGLRIKNKKVTIPQTGGIGSLIFIVAGAAIMIGAFVAYKKSQAVEA